MPDLAETDADTLEVRREIRETQAPGSRRKGESLPCFHCGEPCAGASFSLDGKAFCCFGCQTVFTLLNDNGLGQFYDLSDRPGSRVKSTTGREQFAYLDDPSVETRLLDFCADHQARVTFHLPAIHCVACVWLLENLFRLHPGIGRSTVNFLRREATIAFDKSKLRLSELVSLLAGLGYEPELTFGELDRPKPSSLRRRQWLQIGIAGFAFGNVMLLALPAYIGLDSASVGWFKNVAGWLSLALALPVVTYSAADYWRSAWLSIRQRMLTLDVPIALGLAAIYGQSLFEIATKAGDGYCDSLTGLIFFLLCGRIFQHKTHERLAFDRDYKGFFPLGVLRKSAMGERIVPISSIEVGDRLILRNAELLPGDATLVSGDAHIDYSFVTGESQPVVRKCGDHLYAGGRQIGGSIEVETVKPVSQSYLTSLWNNEAFRKQRNDDLDTMTNRYSRRFTRIVIGVAVSAAFFWVAAGDAARGMKAFTSVLIVACPCALALAAPLALGTAQRLLARMGVFLKNALVVERMADIDTVVLDKTGTLTSSEGRGPQFSCAGRGLSYAELGSVGELARHSTHPFAVRIAQELSASATNAPVTGFKEMPGCGIEGDVGGRKLMLGSRAWLASRGVTIETHRSAAILAAGSPGILPGVAEERGRKPRNPPAGIGRYDGVPNDQQPVTGGSASISFVAIDGECRGAFTLASALRPEVDQLIQRLRGEFQLVLLSGDNGREEQRFRELLGSDAQLCFNQTPIEKLGFVQSLQHDGSKVMMVGDGLNDAGALKQSEVGVAVVEQVGAFSPASDVIVDAAELPRLANVLDFARGTTRVVRAGFVLSAIYNVIGVSIAAAGLLSPIVCAILMPLSSASVVLFAVGAVNWQARRSGCRPVASRTGVAAHASSSPFPDLAITGASTSISTESTA